MQMAKNEKVQSSERNVVIYAQQELMQKHVSFSLNCVFRQRWEAATVTRSDGDGSIVSILCTGQGKIQMGPHFH